MLQEELLNRYGATKKTYSKGDMLFREDEQARYYFQVIRGEVKMFNYNEEGKEFIQGIFTADDSFGEPPLLNDKPYLTNAIANEESELLMLSKPNFMKLLNEDPAAGLAICTRLADRLYYKSIMALEISSEHAEHRLLRFFDFLKFDVAKLPRNQKYHVDLTRQELADLTGLRVETVIRAVKALEKAKALSIEGRKIFR